jgi:hypothetical protein
MPNRMMIVALKGKKLVDRPHGNGVDALQPHHATPRKRVHRVANHIATGRHHNGAGN